MDPDPFTDWCNRHHLHPDLASKLADRNLCGLRTLEELSQLTEEEAEEICTKCQLTVGDRKRFKPALDELRLLSMGGGGDELGVAPSSYPFDIFGEDFEPTNLPNIHESVRLGLGEKWDPKVHGSMMMEVQKRIEGSPYIQNFIVQKRCPVDQATAVMYYTCDARVFHGNENQSIFKIVNPLLAGRNRTALTPWLPFLYHLCCLEDKLPTLKQVTYRGITVPLSQVSRHYYPGNSVIWPAFTSVSTTKQCLQGFSQNKGTWMKIDTIDAKDIVEFSLFRGENEALLFPNTKVTVNRLLTPSEKTLSGVPQVVDCIHLNQNPTPPDHKPLKLLNQRSQKWLPRDLISQDAQTLYCCGLDHYNKKDLQLAFGYFYVASEKGHIPSFFALATMYQRGYYVEQDSEKAEQCYKFAAENGISDAYCRLGAMYMLGDGVERSSQKAKSYFKEAKNDDGRFYLELLGES